MTSAIATAVLPVPVAERGEALVVSLHDVAPGTRETAATILGELKRRGVSSCSLLVVPNYHHRGAISDDRAFASWLQSLQEEGHEVVIHGYFHERARHPGETPWQKLITRFYTDDEGEFYDLSYAEAFRRITTAREEFRRLGFEPRGFIAPAWLLGTEAEAAARDAEMEYTTRLGSVRDLRTRRDYPSPSLVYSVRSGWRRVVSRGWNRALYTVTKTRPLLRISLHPTDHAHPPVWQQVTRLIDEAAGGREVTTYGEWIQQQRLLSD